MNWRTYRQTPLSPASAARSGGLGMAYPTMFNKTNIIRAFCPDFLKNRRVEKEEVMREEKSKKRGTLGNEGISDDIYENKGRKKEGWESPTTVLKAIILYLLSEDVDENKWTY